MDSSRRALQAYGIFFKFQIRFQIIGRKQKNIQTNSELYVIYQWICLDMLYKLIESFFSNFEIIFRINYIFFKILVALGINACVEGEAFVLIITRSIVLFWTARSQTKAMRAVQTKDRDLVYFLSFIIG